MTCGAHFARKFQTKNPKDSALGLICDGGLNMKIHCMGVCVCDGREGWGSAVSAIRTDYEIMTELHLGKPSLPSLRGRERCTALIWAEKKLPFLKYGDLQDNEIVAFTNGVLLNFGNALSYRQEVKI